MHKIKNICIINDDDIFTFILKKSIIKLNICNHVLTYTNGKEAILAFSENGHVLPEIIFLDINMPIMDGWEFLAEFNKIITPQKIAIYIISAHVSDKDIIKVKLNKQITGILADPTEPALIKKIVDAY